MGLLRTTMLFGVWLVACGSGRGRDQPWSAPLTTVGFVYDGPIEAHGWTKAHDDGRRFLEVHTPNVRTLYAENVAATEPDVTKAIDDLVAAGATIVFTTSPEYRASARKATERHLGVTALDCSGFVQGERLGSYQARIEEMEYLSGMVAGAMTTSRRIGIVASMRTREQLLSINAFALGVQAMTPSAEVIVHFTGSSYDPPSELAAARALIDGEGVDVIKQLTRSAEPIRAADRRGVFSVGHLDRDACDVAPSTCLVSAYYDWGPYYTTVVDEIRSGVYPTRTGRIDWVSTSELPIAGLSEFAPVVPERVRAPVLERKEQIRRRMFTVFQGPIVWSDGSTLPAGYALDDLDLLRMDRLVKGVRDGASAR